MAAPASVPPDELVEMALEEAHAAWTRRRFLRAAGLTGLALGTTGVASAAEAEKKRSGGSGGGCSTGSCSKGSVKSADELTAYFAGLRKQMEGSAARVSLH